MISFAIYFFALAVFYQMDGTRCASVTLFPSSIIPSNTYSYNSQGTCCDSNDYQNYVSTATIEFNALMSTQIINDMYIVMDIPTIITSGAGCGVSGTNFFSMPDGISATLKSPWGQSLDFIQNVCTPNSLHINITSAANQVISSSYAASGGSYINRLTARPSASFSIFTGYDLSGTWTMTITSAYNILGYSHSCSFLIFSDSCSANSQTFSMTQSTFQLTFLTVSTNIDCSAVTPAYAAICYQQFVVASLSPANPSIVFAVPAGNLMFSSLGNVASNFMCTITVVAEGASFPSGLQVVANINNSGNTYFQLPPQVIPLNSLSQYVLQTDVVCPSGDISVSFSLPSITQNQTFSMSSFAVFLSSLNNLVSDGSCSTGPSIISRAFSSNLANPITSMNGWNVPSSSAPWFCADNSLLLEQVEGSSFVATNSLNGNSVSSDMNLFTTINLGALVNFVATKQIVFTLSMSYVSTSTSLNIGMFSGTPSSGTKLPTPFTATNIAANQAWTPFFVNATFPASVANTGQVSLQLGCSYVSKTNINCAFDLISLAPSFLPNLPSMCDNDPSLVSLTLPHGFLKESSSLPGAYKLGWHCNWLIDARSFFPNAAVYLRSVTAKSIPSPQDVMLFTDNVHSTALIPDPTQTNLVLSYTGMLQVNFTATTSLGQFQYEFDSLSRPTVTSVYPLGGLGGQPITVTGYDFTSPGGLGPNIVYPLLVVVTLAGNASAVANCSIISSTNTQIVCFLPLGQPSYLTAFVTVIKGPGIRSQEMIPYYYYLPTIATVVPPVAVVASLNTLFTITGYFTSVQNVSVTPHGAGGSPVYPCSINTTVISGTNNSQVSCLLPPSLSVGQWDFIVVSNGIATVPPDPAAPSHLYLLQGPPVISGPVSPSNGNSRTIFTVQMQPLSLPSTALSLFVGSYSCDVTNIIGGTTAQCITVPPALVAQLGQNLPSVQSVTLQIYDTLVSNALAFTIVQRINITNIAPTSGNAGDILTVSGQHFPASYTNATIRIGSVGMCPIIPASYVASSGPSIGMAACILPLGAGFENVTVLNGAEPSDPFYVPFRYLGAPNLTTIQPALGNTIGGDLVTITGTLLGVDATLIAVTIGSFPCTSVQILVPDTAVTCLTPIGFGHANVVDLILLNGNIDASNTSILTFGYYPPTFAQLSPSTSPINMPVSISIFGSNFASPSIVQYYVILGNGTLPAPWHCELNGILKWVSSSLVVCSGIPNNLNALAPVGTPIPVLLIVKFGADSGAVIPCSSFAYSAASVLTGVRPAYGTGDNVMALTLIGNNFPAQAACVFIPVDSTHSMNQISSDVSYSVLTNEYTCLVPSLATITPPITSRTYPFPTNVYVADKRFLNNVSSADTTGYLPASPASAGVFTFVDKIVVTSVCPDAAPINTTYPFDVFALGINEISTLACRIEGVIFPATFQSNTHLRCEIDWNLQSGSFAIELSNDGVIFYPSPTKITLYGLPVRLAIQTQPASVYQNNGPISTQPILAVIDATGFVSQAPQDVVIVTPVIIPLVQSSPNPVMSVDGIVSFSSLEFVGVPGVTYNIEFNAIIVSTGTALPPVISSNVFIPPCDSLLINSVPGGNSNTSTTCVCKPGYYFFQSSCVGCPIDTYKSTAGNDPQCLQCPQYSNTNGQTGASAVSMCTCKTGYYHQITANSNSDLTCLSCDGYVGISCPGGGNIDTQPGFWRPNNVTTSAYRCSVARACEGGVNSQCAPGYQGLVCSECQLGYGKSGLACKQCPDGASNWAVLVLIVIGMIIFLTYLVRETMKEKLNSSSVCLKVFLNYLQVLSFVGSYNVNYPSSLDFIFSFGDITTVSAQSFNVQCALELSFYRSNALTLFLPVILTIAVTIFLVIARVIKNYIKKKQGDENVIFDKKFVNNFTRSLLIILYLFHPILYKQALKALHCVEIENHFVLAVDYSVDCTTSTWRLNATMCILYIIFYTFGGLAVISYFLYRNRENFEDDIAAHSRQMHTSTKRYRFLFYGFRIECYYWEIIILLRKILIVTVGVLFDPATQIFCGILIVYEFRSVSQLKKPFKDIRVQKLEVMSLTVLLATLLGAILFADDSTAGTSGIFKFFAILTFIINFFSILYFLYYLVILRVESSKKLSQYAEKVKEHKEKALRRMTGDMD